MVTSKVKGLALEELVAMNDLATLRKEFRNSALQDRSRVGVETFIVEFNSFDKQIDRDATLITFEVLVKHVS